MKKMRRRRRLKRNVFYTLCALLFICVAIIGFLFWKPMVICKDRLEVGLHTTFDDREGIDLVLFGSKDDVDFEGKVDTSKLGTYEGKYIYKGKEMAITIEVKDLTPPTLKLKSYTTDLIEEVTPEMFVEEVKDDSKISLSFDSTPSKKAGEHKVSVVARDANGNETIKETTLIRQEDTTKPNVEVRGALAFYQGEKFEFKDKITIQDDFDRNPKVDVDTSRVNFKKPGTYPVRYLVEDRSGNKTEVKTTVRIRPEDEKMQKIVYLTFDDGPSHNTAEIIDVLERYDAKATFFVTGARADCYENITKAYKAGHSIGLHTYSHNYASLYSSIDAYFQDLNQISDLVEELTKEKSYLIRFPGGSSNTISANYTSGIMSTLSRMVQERGYQYFDWNCDSTDANGNKVPVSTIVANATSSNAQYINILMHDTDAKDTTVQALPQIIEYYRSQGYVFKGLELDSFAPHHGINN